MTISNVIEAMRSLTFERELIEAVIATGDLLPQVAEDMTVRVGLIGIERLGAATSTRTHLHRALSAHGDRHLTATAGGAARHAHSGATHH